MEKLIQQRAQRRQKTPSPQYSRDSDWEDNYSPNFNF